MESNMTLREAWKLYSRTMLRKQSKKSQGIEIGRYNNYVDVRLGFKKLEDINEVDLLYLRADLEDAHLSDQTIYHILSLVRKVMNKAAEWKHYDKRLPSFRDALPKFDNKRIRYLTPEELKTLLQNLKKIESSHNWYDIALFAVNTGLRKSEIFNLRIEHIDFNNHTAFIVNTKSNKNRICCLNSIACGVIAKKIAAMGPDAKRSNLLFHCQNERVFRQAVLDSGLNDGISDNLNKVVFHTLRHTFASWLVQAGYPIPLVSQMLGHSSINVTMKYSHLAPTQEWQAVQSVNDHMRIMVSMRQISAYFKDQTAIQEYKFTARAVVEQDDAPLLTLAADGAASTPEAGQNAQDAPQSPPPAPPKPDAKREGWDAGKNGFKP